MAEMPQPPEKGLLGNGQRDLLMLFHQLVVAHSWLFTKAVALNLP